MVFKREEEKKKTRTGNGKVKGERVKHIKEMLYLEIKMQENGDLTNHKRKNEKIKCGDETSMGNRRTKVPRRLQKKDDAV